MAIESFFNPKSVAVIGASGSPGKVGYAVFTNLVDHGYEGKVYPINPKSAEIKGIPCFKTVMDVPDEIELGIVVVPNQFIFQVVEECGKKGVKAMIIISAGFKETGPRGAKIEKRLIAQAKKYGIRVMGPNCLGLISTHTNLNASFAVGMPKPGKIAFLSQSGAFCTAILDWAIGHNVGFSHFVSLGNKGDLSEVEFIEDMGKDPNTKVILIYQEGVNNGREFMEAARKVVKSKPIIVLKAGGTAAGARAASSHTGSLAGSDKAYEYAFRQSGIIRARSVRELFDYGRAFASQRVPTDGNIAIITNAGGPGIIATDAVDGTPLKMAHFEKKTVDALREVLPPVAAFYNPVDVIGDAPADRFGKAVEIVSRDRNVDIVLGLVAPTDMVVPADFADAVHSVAENSTKTFVTSFMGHARMNEGIAKLQNFRIPNYENPDEAVRAISAMVNHHQWLEIPEEEPTKFQDVDRQRAKRVFNKVFDEDRINLTEVESKDVLRAYNIRTVPDKLAENIQEAVEAAQEIGYPVVMKIVSPEILHKTDVGGVIVGVEDDEGVRDAFMQITANARRYMPEAYIQGVSVQKMAPKGREVIIGGTRDPQFGPMIMFGLGGVYVEILKDVSFRIAPLTPTDAKQMIREIQSHPLLFGVRGEPPVDITSIAEYIQRISQIMTDFPEVDQIDINPLRVLSEGEGSYAIDARFILREA